MSREVGGMFVFSASCVRENMIRCKLVLCGLGRRSHLITCCELARCSPQFSRQSVSHRRTQARVNSYHHHAYSRGMRDTA